MGGTGGAVSVTETWLIVDDPTGMVWVTTPLELLFSTDTCPLEMGPVYTELTVTELLLSWDEVIWMGFTDI